MYDKTWAAVGKKDNKHYYYTNWMYVNMYFTSSDCFFNEEFRAIKTFLKNEKGEITGYTRTVDGKDYPPAVKVTNVDTIHLENQEIGNIGWYLFENKQYREAISYFKRGVQLYPEDLNMKINLAHMFVFNGNYEEALAIYKEHLNAMIKPGYSWQDLMRDDRIYFKDHSYDVAMFDKIFAALNVDIQKRN